MLSVRHSCPEQAHRMKHSQTVLQTFADFVRSMFSDNLPSSNNSSLYLQNTKYFGKVVTDDFHTSIQTYSNTIKTFLKTSLTQSNFKYQYITSIPSESMTEYRPKKTCKTFGKQYFASESHFLRMWFKLFSFSCAKYTCKVGFFSEKNKSTTDNNLFRT